jgi:peroxiredoxin Q/BCP
MREFRVHHAELLAQDARVAGVTLDSIESCRAWARRMRLPYPLLSDPGGVAGERCHVLRHLGIGGWNVEFFRRSTFLVDTAGIVRAVWGDVRIRGHATQVLAAIRGLKG